MTTVFPEHVEDLHCTGSDWRCNRHAARDQDRQSYSKTLHYGSALRLSVPSQKKAPRFDSNPCDKNWQQQLCTASPAGVERFVQSVLAIKTDNSSSALHLRLQWNNPFNMCSQAACRDSKACQRRETRDPSLLPRATNRSSCTRLLT